MLKKINRQIKNKILKNKFFIFIALGLILISISIYWPALKGSFLTWDDIEQVNNNKDVINFNFFTIKKIFSNFYLGMYQPLATISYALEYKIFGANSFYFHLDNLIIHFVNTILVYCIFIRLNFNKKIAGLTAIFFALWPTQVETVAWISTRSTLLCSSFFLASILCWLDYLKNNNRKKYGWSIILFIFSLLSKVAALPLPIILFLIDYAKKRKINKKLILEKLPFFIITFIFGLIAIKARTADDAQFQIVYTTNKLGKIIINYGYSFFLQIKNILLPFQLSPVYYYVFEPLKILYSLSFVAFFLPIYFFRKKQTVLAVWLCFPILISVSLVHIHRLNYAAADRYTYLACLSFLFLLAYGLDYLSQKRKKLSAILSLIIILTVSFLSAKQATIWKNSESIWLAAVNNQNSVMSYNYLVNYYLISKNQNEEKIAAVMPIICKRKDLNASSQTSCGLFYYEHKDYQMALFHYIKAIEENPNEPKYYYNRGLTALQLNAVANACKDFKQAEKLGFTIDQETKKNCP
ncbi:MAG: hypothetical protein PHR00_00930 [Patescibacteria group bacterium]|nr:hypothetical protein [Patescibacteria group bacterium]